MRTVTEVDAYVESNGRRFLEDLKELCSFGSISNEGEAALRPCREWLGERLSRHTERVETLQAGGMASLFAEIPGEGRRRLLLYTHYDVQPVDPVDLWDSPPFEPAERNGRVYARGVCDDKADVMARLHAIETLKAVHGSLPLSIRFLIEGEEEIGSPTFETIIERSGEKLRADGCLWESSHYNSAGTPEVHFGCRGMLYVQLRVRLLDFDQHSGYASIYPSAAMYLVRALESLRDADLNIRIPGFYDAVVAPSEEVRRMMARIDPELDERKRLVGFEVLVRNPAPERVIEQMLFLPTCNIAGITTGYQGPGSKTVLPAEATAKLDFRLVPDQDPEDIRRKLRSHLDSHGFEKVEIVSAQGEKPARSDPGSEIARAVVGSVRDSLGEPLLWPMMPGTGPMHPIAKALGIPTVAPTGVGRPDARIHAPNENIAADDYLTAVKLMCSVFQRFGAAA